MLNEEAKESLKSAIQLIFEDRLADIRRGLPKEAIEEIISISLVGCVFAAINSVKTPKLTIRRNAPTLSL